MIKVNKDKMPTAKTKLNLNDRLIGEVNRLAVYFQKKAHAIKIYTSFIPLLIVTQTRIRDYYLK